MAKFINPSGLKSIGKNLFTQTSASGDAVLGTPGLEGFGTISQGFVEISNVDIVEELIEMIVAQRAYETNSRSVRTADEMLNRAINLGR
ncbi:MAG: Flagellar basal-body rod protein FlgG [Synergistetes bacterium ADurb.BinA166]|nr:MAG: Flagellar basal-body rod protein FlgG [Synergistetes bacterium ADurb.BinA166]